MRSCPNCVTHACWYLLCIQIAPCLHLRVGVKKGSLAGGLQSAFGATWHNDGKITAKSWTGYTDTATTSWSRNNFHWLEGISMTGWRKVIFVTIVMILRPLFYEEIVKLTSVLSFNMLHYCSSPWGQLFIVSCLTWHRTCFNLIDKNVFDKPVCDFKKRLSSDHLSYHFLSKRQHNAIIGVTYSLNTILTLPEMWSG